MTKEELKREIELLADACDASDEQQAVKSVLLGLLGAMCAKREFAFMDHMAQFAEREIKRMTAGRN